MYSNKNRKTVATVFVVALACSLPAAAMDTAFSYQARLDDGGSPASGTYDFRFFLYDADAGGSQVGSTLYADAIVVTNGLFTVYLDFGSGIFDGDPLWLEVAVRPGGSVDAYTPLFPRQAIMPSPYSLHAGTIEIGAIGSAEVQDNSLTATDLGAGSVGTSEVIDGSITAADLASNSVYAAEIGTNAVGSSEIADGSVTSTDIANGTIMYADTNTGSVQRRVTGSCAPNYSIRAIASNGTVTCQQEHHNVLYVSDLVSAWSYGDGEKTTIWMKPTGISGSACFLTRTRYHDVDGSSEYVNCEVHEASTHWWIEANATSGEDNWALCKMRCLYWFAN